MNIAVIIYSRHHIEDAENYFCFWRECALNQPKCIYDSTNLSWYSFTYRSEYKFFYEYLQIAFPNNVLVSKFHDECG